MSCIPGSFAFLLYFGSAAACLDRISEPLPGVRCQLTHTMASLPRMHIIKLGESALAEVVLP